jgi:hypothetical protein
MNKSWTTNSSNRETECRKKSDLTTGPEKNTTVNTPDEQRTESLLLDNQSRIYHNTLMIRTGF